MAEVMEMGREEKVEVMGSVEVESCGLEARQRRSLRSEHGGEFEDHEDEEEEVLEEKKEVEFQEEGGRSVYFDKHHGFNVSDQIVARNSEFLDEFVAVNSVQNRELVLEAKEFNGHADFSIKNQTQTFMTTSVDNGSSSYVFSAEKTETTTLETEIKEENGVKIDHKSKLQVTEFDVERVLEEQETHDLFCPNCRSCITKRVILRKRKRTVQESKYDFKHQKVPVTKNDLDVTAVLPESPDEDIETKREVFGCFECFRFFTIKDGGFDICGIFRRRPEGEMPLLDQREAPTTKWSWSSIFGTNISKPKETMTNERSFEEQEYSNEGVSVPLLIKIPEFPVHGEQIIPEKNDDYLSGNETSGKGLPEEQKDDSGKDRLDTHLIEIRGSGVHGEQIIIEEKVFDPNRNNSKGKELSEGPNENLDKNRPDAHLICIPESLVPGEISGGDFIKSVEEGIVKPIGPTTSVNVPPIPGVIASPSTEEEKNQVTKERTRNEWDILKSIVYGGLIESITSLGVVSSAAGSDASTLNIVALGLANLFGGLFVIVHNLYDLRKERQETRGETEAEPASRYWELLGRQKNFRRHVIVAVISYLIFGLLPPVIYGFSFRKSDNREYKLIVIAAASLLCIALLAISKAHVRLEKDYFKCLTYYIGLGVTASGLSFAAGVLIHQFLDKLGLFDPQANVPAPPSVGFILNGPKSPFWSSY
ncbi:hypothetical protein IHE45_02G012500 [Dioscorea alata]|uniref:Uncharacterized protein n=1 Tax=Dioscorea alata TaxID=55571 RepID=A0ACB7WN31_DIOAL|nr:hypothetical protein IHE45_02G012500 [Dioscorea alata]